MSIRLRVAALSAAVLVLGGCGSGSDVRDLVDETYDLQSSSGDTAVYTSDEPVAGTTASIAAAVPAAARAADGGSEFLRYAEDIVIVAPAAAGSTVQIEDLDGRYRSGAFRYLGPGFDPGSPAGGGGGPGDVK